MGDSKTTKDSNEGGKGSQAQPKPVASQGSKSSGSGDKGKKPADQGDDKGKKPVKEDKKSKPDDDKGKKPDDKGKKPDTKPDAQHSKTLQASQGSDDEGDYVPDLIADLSAALQRVREGGIQVTIAAKLYNENMRVFKELMQANSARKMLDEKEYSPEELEAWKEKKDSKYSELLVKAVDLGGISRRALRRADYIAYSKYVVDFLKADAPQALFINGNEDVEGKPEGVYATGVIAMRIFKVSSEMEGDVTMAWTCTANPDRTPTDMVHCLLGQIASPGAIVKLPDPKSPVGVSFRKLLQYIKDAIKTNLKTRKVWCNIEGTSKYEDKHRKDEIMLVMRELVDMVVLSRSVSVPFPFNLLMVSPTGGECYNAYKKRAVEGDPKLKIAADPELKFIMGPDMVVKVTKEGAVKPNESESSSEGSSATITPGLRGSGTATPLPGGSRRS
ncbi:hypothetical protein LTR37_020550 [Vermiconidia calcicola]|uniref:Uncharacterized protein n=1 Tax=Vermiconidia calcicola TaxID=1690605 RepID=A0ACC3MB14_9PEZI|nr:hypothetical protein LTR37_020550 [Vermiconidia calcicola]